MLLLEREYELTLEELKALGIPVHGSSSRPRHHAFWAGPMPDPNGRPECHESIRRLYEFADPPLEYVDAYHEIMGGAPVFNQTIQDVLIRGAIYIVIDLSIPRHDVLFEAGFGFGTGIQTILYFDARSSIRSKYTRESGRFTNLDSLKKEMPPHLQDVIFAQPPRKVPKYSEGTRVVLDKLAVWLNQFINKPGHNPSRRECCRVHFEDKPCEFARELARVPRGSREQYFFSSFQEAHEDQEQLVRSELLRIGLLPVENVAQDANNEHPLCRACFELQVADLVVIDGTSSDLYSGTCGCSAFLLGMATGRERTLRGKSTKSKRMKIKMLYDEDIGPIGMFAGARAGWLGAKWREQIARELHGW